MWGLEVQGLGTEGRRGRKMGRIESFKKLTDLTHLFHIYEQMLKISIILEPLKI
jgi:hypothetical protein